MILWLCSSLYPPTLHTPSSFPTSRTHVRTHFLATTKIANPGTTSARIPRSHLITDAVTSVRPPMKSRHYPNLTHNGLLRHGMDVLRPTDSPLVPSQMSTTSRAGSGLDVHITRAPHCISAPLDLYHHFTSPPIVIADLTPTSRVL
jgi:hypothetical protein